MPRFLILDDAVHRQATNLGTTVEDLQRVLQQYHGTAQNTFTNWIGLGAEAFQQFDARFQSIAQGLVTSLETLRAEVDTAGIDYDNNETAQQAAVNTLRVLEWVPQEPADATAPPAGDGGDGGDDGDGFWDGVGDFFGGVAHPFREMWDSAWQLFTDPGEWLDQTWDGIYDSVAFWNWDTFVETWKETGKDFVAWDEWDDNWPRALGITLTNVGLTVATLGVGALVRRFLLNPRGGGDGNNGEGDGGNGDGDGGGDSDGGQPPDTPEQNRQLHKPPEGAPGYDQIHRNDASNEHILEGEDYRRGGHGPGTGFPGKTEFPSWDSDPAVNDRMILESVDAAAQNPVEPWEPGHSPGRWTYQGEAPRPDGGTLRIEIVVDQDGRIVSAYPTGGQPGVYENPPRPETPPPHAEVNRPLWTRPDPEAGRPGYFTYINPNGTQIYTDVDGNVIPPPE